VRMWVYEEEVEVEGVKRCLSGVINERNENIKYLAGINLGPNLIAEPDLEKAVADATMLVCVTPHQFVKNLAPKVKAGMSPGAVAVSLIKGMDVTSDGFNLISELLSNELGVSCSVLMGANIAKNVAQEEFSEATLGYPVGQEASATLWTKLFNTSYFHVNAVPDTAGCEMCGTLKNIVALGAGFVDGLQLGDNSKAAIMRVGFLEMRELSKEFFPGVRDSTFWESAGFADLIATCFGGRNRRCAEAFAKAHASGEPKTFDIIEAELLNGQKLQGVLTSQEVQVLLQRRGLESRFPLLTTINKICKGEVPPSHIVHYKE